MSTHPNPIGTLQQRMQRLSAALPIYECVTEVGPTHNKEFITRVTLGDGLKVEATASTKKLSKHNAAKAMLDILDGKAKAINDEVIDSIDVGLKALRESVKLEEPKSEPFCHSKVPNVFAKEKRRKKKKKEFPLRKKKEPPPVYLPSTSTMVKPVESLSTWMANLIMQEVNQEIDKRRTDKEPLPEEICKLCNLVFLSEKHCNKHLKSDFHDRVKQGEYPGHGGYHCFLCWVTFLQPESLLNHVARPNHQDRAKLEGVRKVWMEPVPIVPTWDTIQMFKDLRELAEEEEKRFRRSRSRSPRRSVRKARRLSPDAEIKAGVGGDWRVGREKTFRQTEHQNRYRDRGHRHHEEVNYHGRNRRMDEPYYPQAATSYSSRSRRQHVDKYDNANLMPLAPRRPMLSTRQHRDTSWDEIDEEQPRRDSSNRRRHNDTGDSLDESYLHQLEAAELHVMRAANERRRQRRFQRQLQEEEEEEIWRRQSRQHRGNSLEMRLHDEERYARRMDEAEASTSKRHSQPSNRRRNFVGEDGYDQEQRRHKGESKWRQTERTTSDLEEGEFNSEEEMQRDGGGKSYHRHEMYYVKKSKHPRNSRPREPERREKARTSRKREVKCESSSPSISMPSSISGSSSSSDSSPSRSPPRKKSKKSKAKKVKSESNSKLVRMRSAILGILDEEINNLTGKD